MEKKKSKKVRKIILIVIAVILLIILVHTVRNAIIISDLNSKIKPYVNSNNYYIKVENLTQDSTAETYKKDEKYLTILKTTTQNVNRSVTNYSDGKTINTYIESGENKIAILNSNGLPSPIQVINWFNIDSNWHLILMSMTSFIKTEKCNEKECYKITNLQSPTILYAEEDFAIYIDKETGLVERMTNGSIKDSNGNVSKIVTQYKYQFNSVTDKDLIEPDVREYTIKENN